MGGACFANTSEEKCVLVEKPTGNRLIGKSLGVDGKIILKRICK